MASRLLIVLALLCGPAFAATLAEDLTAAAAVGAGDHKAWLAARERLTARGNAALNDLAAEAAPDKWTAEAWPRALAAEVARLRIARPELAAAVDAPRGIDPEHYRQTRLGRPEVRRDFARLGAEAAPLMLEHFRWLLDSREYTEGDAGKAERETLARALLATPGQFMDARARHAMLAAVRDDKLPVMWRQDAAVSLGQTGGVPALANLGEVIDNPQNPLALREGAAWALGRVFADESLAALRSRLADPAITGAEHGPALVRALANGLGILGSSYAAHARGVEFKEQNERIRRGCAEQLVALVRAHPAESAAIADALATVAWADSLPVLEAMANDESAAENIREAARACLPPLRAALAREK